MGSLTRNQLKPLLNALETAESHLLDARCIDGHWRGRLSASALSTATACAAIGEVQNQLSKRGESLEPRFLELYHQGQHWLAHNTNPDGGWGDTLRSQSNLSTTLLCWATLAMPDTWTQEAAQAGRSGPTEQREKAQQSEKTRQSEQSSHTQQAAIARARAWVLERTGSLEAAALKRSIEDSYGVDRTFSIPILTHCSLCGLLGPREQAFRNITQLPFELAALPQSWFRFLGLPVVSYALPALIAVGQVQHHHHPSRLWPLRALRDRLRATTLRRLQAIQPASGGFLEAIPLTAFVTMSLAGAGHPDHPVARKALWFLEHSMREDGSWPIDIDLATWVTTLSVSALSVTVKDEPVKDEPMRNEPMRNEPSPDANSAVPRAVTLNRGERPPNLLPPTPLPPAELATIKGWLLDQQHREQHPFTGAAPGGWAWTDLPGGVPDADDTSGALLALRALDGSSNSETITAAEAGLEWLLGLINRDGGIPTFCRGWGKLPFDRSASDLTAHALRAFSAWRGDVAPALAHRLAKAEKRMLRFLQRTQRADGAWIPLWFGNENVAGWTNPTFGTGRTLRALQDTGAPMAAPLIQRARDWLVQAQGESGGWGGDHGITPTIEETAIAVDALAGSPKSDSGAWEAALAGAQYLAERVSTGDLEKPAPIGFYFANLWYYEDLYPSIFAVSALRRFLAANS